MDNRIWQEIPTRQGASEVAARVINVPQGPYFLVEQGKETDFLQHFYTMTHVPLDEFQMKLGYATYAIDITSGLPLRVAYHYDTSD